MTRIILAASLAAIILLNTGAANAGTYCQTIGKFTYCTDDSGNRITCEQIGNNTNCY